MRRFLWLALAALAAFGDSLRGSFHFDDYSLLQGNWPWGLAQTRPLTQLTFWLNFQAGGTHAWGYHAVNLTLHVAVVLLLFRVLRAYLSETQAFGASLLFAIHPLQSEAVAYVFARGTLLSTLFCLLAWWAWKQGREWAAMAWFAVALLCKEECVAFPIFLWLIGPRRAWKPVAGMLALGAAVGLRTLYATKVVAGSGAGFTAGIAPWEYLAAQGAVVLRYFRLAMVPWGFSVDPDIRFTRWEEALGWAALIAFGVALRKRAWFVGGLILLIPSSTIFPAADLAADRRMYLPMISFCALLPPIRKWMVALGGTILVALSIGRMEVWKTEQTLWREAVGRAPEKARPRIQLARTVPPVEALEVLKEAPSTAEVITERGRVYLELAKPADALREFGAALAMRPGDAHAINNRGAALLALGQREAARKDFEAALRREPGLTEARDNLARARAPK